MLTWLLGDRRLIGRWRSDRERTMAEWPFPAGATEAQREQVARIFGKLELEYGRWRCQSTYENEASTGWYRVVARDATSVMIVSRRNGPIAGRERSLFHIHFAGEHYWITLGESNTREFFRRLA
jgi:hypothetical protein